MSGSGGGDLTPSQQDREAFEGKRMILIITPREEV